MRWLLSLLRIAKDIFEPILGLYFQNKETVLELNGCTIEAYPSDHIDSYRALDNHKFILLDESDFFRKENKKTSEVSLNDISLNQVPLLLRPMPQMVCSKR